MALACADALLNITFILNRCHYSFGAGTPVKYEGDSKVLIHTFAKSNSSLHDEEINKWSISNTNHKLEKCNKIFVVVYIKKMTKDDKYACYFCTFPTEQF